MQDIRLVNLSFSYPSKRIGGVDIFQDLSLDIDAGDFVVILGESGCGKTTLLELIAGLIPPPPDSIFAAGECVTGPDPQRIMIFQQARLLPWLSVRENIAFGCKLRGDTANLMERTAELISLMGLDDFADERPHKLSVGMAQRVSIARGIIGNPHLLLLDEPYTSLDIYNRRRLQREIAKLWGELGFTAVFVTHDIDEALVLGRRIVVLGGRPAEILADFEPAEEPPRSSSEENLIALRREIEEVFERRYREESIS